MKKHIILFLCIITCSITLADTVPVEQARCIAFSFFSGKNRTHKAKTASRQMTVSVDDLELVYPVNIGDDTPEYYIFNKKNDKGFVIVSGETGTQQILAYSDECSFDITKKPNGAGLFLYKYRREIQEVRARSRANVVETKSIDWGEGRRLETACWGQDEPWCHKTPKFEDGWMSPTGCAATAMSIIMQYYKWPLRGKGSFSYNTQNYGIPCSSDFSSHEYKWTILPREYAGEGWTEEANEQAATIAYDCGVSISTNYQWDESGANMFAIADAMSTYFSYASSAEYIELNSDDSKHESVQMLKNEIDCSRPVIIAGNGKTPEEGRRYAHGFIMDGYDSNGLFHYNFGWGGKDNGYYANGVISSYNFVLDYALIGLCPDYSGLNTGKCGDNASWTYRPDSTLVISGYGNMQDFTENNIPWKEFAKDIRNVSITGVSNIGDNAFAQCSRLYSLVIPSSVKVLGDNIVTGCSSLSTITMEGKTPASCKTNTFVGFNKSQCIVYVPEGVIDSYTSAKEWTGFFKIKHHAIGIIAGGMCGEKIEWYLKDDGTLVLEGTGATYDYKQNFFDDWNEAKFAPWLDCNGKDLNPYIKNIEVKEGITALGEHIFMQLYWLDSAHLPSTLEKIGLFAFMSSGLKHINFPKNLAKIEDSAFAGCSFEELIIPGDCKAFTTLPWNGNGGYFSGCTDLKRVVFEDGCKVIPGSCFSGCSNLVDVQIANSVEEMAYATFFDCISLKTIELPANLKTIDMNNFEGTASLESINISPENEYFISIEGSLYTKSPKKLISIPGAIKHLKIPGDIVIEIENDLHAILGNLPMLESIEVEDDSEYFSLHEGILYNKDRTILYKYPPKRQQNTVNIPEGVEIIRGNAFLGCQSIENVNFPSSLKVIGGFEHCSSLKEVEIPDGVHTIDNSAFFFCESLCKVKFPKSLRYIGNCAFYCCALEDIELPEGLEIIEQAAFDLAFDRKDLSTFKIRIPSTCKFVGAEAFSQMFVWGVGTYPLVVTCEPTVPPTSHDYGEIFYLSKVDTVYVKKGYGNVYKNSKVWGQYNIVEYEPTELSIASNDQTIDYDGKTHTLNVIGVPSEIPNTDIKMSIHRITDNADVLVSTAKDPGVYRFDFTIDNFYYSGSCSALLTVNIPKFQVTFIVDEDTIYTEKLDYKASIVAPKSPTKEGYSFSGWSPRVNTIVPLHDVTYKALFTLNKYKVHYFVDKELVHEDEVEYGANFTLYDYIPSEGYTFNGWIGEKYSTMPAHDIDYHADMTNGIDCIMKDDTDCVYYDISGHKVYNIKRNRINIKRQKDGKTVKILQN